MTSIDQRAGVLLGFSGLLVGLVFTNIDRIGEYGLAGAVVAAIAGGFAAAVIFPNSANVVGPYNLLNHYVDADRQTSRLRTLMTFADIFDEEEHRVERKGLLLKAALALLPVAGVLLIIGATLETAERSAHHQGVRMPPQRSTQPDADTPETTQTESSKAESTQEATDRTTERDVRRLLRSDPRLVRNLDGSKRSIKRAQEFMIARNKERDAADRR
ncbi:MAG TPA: hypothetical protein VIW24_06875 [Aldersonia sp.]